LYVRLCRGSADDDLDHGGDLRVDQAWDVADLSAVRAALEQAVAFWSAAYPRAADAVFDSCMSCRLARIRRTRPGSGTIKPDTNKIDDIRTYEPPEAGRRRRRVLPAFLLGRDDRTEERLLLVASRWRGTGHGLPCIFI
jgi:hypothetical protein